MSLVEVELMSEKSPTECLRAMLDERGIEWGAPKDEENDVTFWSTHYGEDWTAFENADGKTVFLSLVGGTRDLTPEQAIAATVGTPTCTMEPDGYYQEEYGIYKCSNCGELWQFECDGPKEHGWTCCPKCQARIEVSE